MTYNDQEVCKCVELPLSKAFMYPRRKIHSIYKRNRSKRNSSLYSMCTGKKLYFNICSRSFSERTPGIYHSGHHAYGAWYGNNSKIAMQKLMVTIYSDIMDVKPVNLIITSKQYTDEEIKPENS